MLLNIAFNEKKKKFFYETQTKICYSHRTGFNYDKYILIFMGVNALKNVRNN